MKIPVKLAVFLNLNQKYKFLEIKILKKNKIFHFFFTIKNFLHLSDTLSSFKSIGLLSPDKDSLAEQRVDKKIGAITLLTLFWKHMKFTKFFKLLVFVNNCQGRSRGTSPVDQLVVSLLLINISLDLLEIAFKYNPFSLWKNENFAFLTLMGEKIHFAMLLVILELWRIWGLRRNMKMSGI